MCGRGGLDFSWARLWSFFNLDGEPPSGGIRKLNIAPSRKVGGEVDWTWLPTIQAKDGKRHQVQAIWPLIPPWLRGELPRFSTANCRSEADQPLSLTLAGKPTFRNAWRRNQRCLVPMSWFYEWDQRTKPREPWRVFPTSEPFFAMAGLWERQQSKSGAPIYSVAIMTTEPNTLLREIGHHRAPLILDSEDCDIWLQGKPQQAESVVRPPEHIAMDAEQVTRRVNNPGYQGEDLIDPKAAGDS